MSEKPTDQEIEQALKHVFEIQDAAQVEFDAAKAKAATTKEQIQVILKTLHEAGVRGPWATSRGEIRLVRRSPGKGDKSAAQFALAPVRKKAAQPLGV